MASSPGNERPRYVFIDALRGFAALAVVFFHAKEGHHIDAFSAVLPGFLREAIAHGDLGVQVFFVLSGFVIAHSMARHDVTAGYVGRFMLRRSIRLDPPYWASMALVVAFGLVSARFVPGKVYELPTVADVLAHVAYLPVLLGRGLMNPVYWTLCLEIQFYLVFSLLMWVATRLRPSLGERLAFLVWVVPAVIVANLWAIDAAPFDVPGLFLGQWHLFLAGVLVWRAVTYPDDALVGRLAWADLLLLGAAAVVLRDPARAVGTLAAATILAVGRADKLHVWLAARPLQWLGLISYSLYLTHNSITGAAFRIGYRLTGRTVATEGFWFVAVVAICVVAAYVFHLVFERPSLNLSRRIALSPAPKTAEQTGAATAVPR